MCDVTRILEAIEHSDPKTTDELLPRVYQELLTLEGTGSGFYKSAFSPDDNVIGFPSNDRILILWRAPSCDEINAAEAKDPPSPGYGGQGKAESKQP